MSVLEVVALVIGNIASVVFFLLMLADAVSSRFELRRLKRKWDHSPTPKPPWNTPPLDLWKNYVWTKQRFEAAKRNNPGVRYLWDCPEGDSLLDARSTAVVCLRPARLDYIKNRHGKLAPRVLPPPTQRELEWHYLHERLRESEHRDDLGDWYLVFDCPKGYWLT